MKQGQDSHKALETYNRKYKCCKSYIFCLVYFVFTGILMALQIISMAKTISLFTANAEVQYIAPKDVSLVHSVANQANNRSGYYGSGGARR